MIIHCTRYSGRFRTTMTIEGRGPKTSMPNGSRSVFVLLSRRSLGTFSAAVACYVLAHPSLRGMSEVLASFSWRLQFGQEWLVPASGRERNVPGMDSVLFMWNATQFQPL